MPLSSLHSSQKWEVNDGIGGPFNVVDKLVRENDSIGGPVNHVDELFSSILLKICHYSRREKYLDGVPA